MLLFKDFSFVHLPKAGGSFVEKILLGTLGGRRDRGQPARGPVARRFHEFVTGTKPWCYWSVAPQMLLFGHAELLKHGFAEEMPGSRKHLPVLGVFRDPLDRYISQFEFRWFARSGVAHPRASEIKAKFPEWPGSESFAENFAIRNEFFSTFQRHLPLEGRVGIQTEEFVSFFCKNPARLLANGSQGLSPREVAENLYDVHLLNMGRLNADLALFLEARGMSGGVLEMVRGHGRVLPGSKGREVHGNIGDYFGAGLLREAQEKEKIALHFWRLVQKGCRTKQEFRAATASEGG
jgi:hypothetical protein